MRKIQKKQAGFTILEIGIVMIILVSLVVAFSSNLWQKQEAADIQLIKLWFSKSVPEAITTCRMINGNAINTISATQLQACGLDTTTLYGETWTTATPSGGTITFTYNMANAANLTGMTAGLEALDNQNSSITAADVTGTAYIVTVRLR